MVELLFFIAGVTVAYLVSKMVVIKVDKTTIRSKTRDEVQKVLEEISKPKISTGRLRISSKLQKEFLDKLFKEDEKI